MGATVLLLDVDGPVNGGGRCGWHGPPRTGKAYAHGGWAYRIRWAPQAIDRLRALHTSGAASIRWATTWIDHEVTQIERLVGLPPLGLTYPPDAARAVSETFRTEHRAAKLAAALAVVRSGARLIWVDDDAIPAAGPDRDELDAAGALLIAPDDRRGLRPEDLDMIEEYARQEP